MADLVDETNDKLSFEAQLLMSHGEHKVYFEKYSGNPTGICENCDTLIPTSRLEAIPNAMYCVKCQELADNDQL